MANNIRESYEKLWSEGWETETEYHGPSSRHRKRLILNILKQYKHCKLDILDIGCGDGFVLKSLTNYPLFQLFGMDVSQKAIELAQKRAGTNIQYIVGDLQSQEELPKRKFDFIICSEVLEHLPEDKLALSNLAYLLSPKGKLLLTLPHNQEYWTPHDTAAAHLRRYEKQELIEKLQKNGFKVLRGFTWGYPLYNLYYNLVLKQLKPESTWEKKKGGVKVLAFLAYLLFFFDDFFIKGDKGRVLMVLAEKVDSH
ncbi:MAG: methyltransferase domain-containing protein [Candidatus Schekmanbacteria bacterium]|nr:methyltransferase domain-containing protein [Candidatus Schekmanbacteria bacterium]